MPYVKCSLVEIFGWVGARVWQMSPLAETNILMAQFTSPSLTHTGCEREPMRETKITSKIGSMNPIIKSELLLLFVPGAEDIQERRHVTCPGVTCDKMLACDAVTL